MFQTIGDNIGTLFGLLVVMWLVQFGFTYLQMRRFYARLKIIRQDGLTAVGMAGTKYRGRSYGILTVDQDHMVIHAEKMSGWSNFSGLKPVPGLVGMSVDQILDEETDLPVPRTLQSAFRDAATHIHNAVHGSTDEEQSSPPGEELEDEGAMASRGMEEVTQQKK